MFGPAGHLYVYFTYGMHHCANVVCGPEGEAAAVLLRAGEVVDGLDVARGAPPGVRDRDLARGPGRLCRALAPRPAHDGLDVRDAVRLGRPTAAAAGTGPRVGLRLAADRPWRFWVAGRPHGEPLRPGRAAAPAATAPSRPGTCGG